MQCALSFAFPIHLVRMICICFTVVWHTFIPWGRKHESQLPFSLVSNSTKPASKPACWELCHQLFTRVYRIVYISIHLRRVYWDILNLLLATTWWYTLAHHDPWCSFLVKLRWTNTRWMSQFLKLYWILGRSRLLLAVQGGMMMMMMGICA